MSPAMAPASLMPVTPPTSSGPSTPPQATAPGALDAASLDPKALDPKALDPKGVDPKGLDPKALATGPPGDSGAPPGASPPTDAFATVLSDQVARTALAEGPKGASPKTPGRRSDKAAEAADGAAAPAPGPATGDRAAVDSAAAALSIAPAVVSAATAPVGSAKAAGADADAAHNKADTSDRKSAAAVPTPPVPSAAAAKASAATGKTPPVAVSAAHVAAKATAPISTSAVDGARGISQTTTSPLATRPLTTATATPYGVRLEQAAETVRTTIAMAARQGSSSARIQLSPASLGGVQIHLQRTPDGLVARVIAEHPEAAQTLAQHGDDLRRSLQQSGMTLLRLDIESSDRRDASAQQQGASGSASRAVAGTGEDGGMLDAVSDTTSIQISAHDLSDSALVNVLA